MMTRDARPPDLEMQVRIRSDNGRTRLIYILHSPTGAASFSHQEMEGPVFQGRPEEFQAYLLHKIERLGHGLDVDGSGLLRNEIEHKLTSLGRDLWRDLFVGEIRHAYRIIRRQVRCWMIISDEPWIPWELVKPYDMSLPEDPIGDDFLAFQFELTRWLAGGKPAVQEITVRSFAAFQSAPDLPQVERELSLFKDLDRLGAVDVTPSRVNSAGQVLGFLASSDVELIHFIGHGTQATQPDEMGIPFRNGSFLRPGDLHGLVEDRIGQCRPLVFLNACWAGQQGWSLTRLGGWAARWVGVCGCGSFVAPLWPVRNQTAVAFAWAFYNALLRGRTLGRATLAARRYVRKGNRGNPSVLAYTVYGHPNARLVIGGGLANSAAPGERPPRRPPLRRARAGGPFRSALRPRKSVMTGASVALAGALTLRLLAGPILALWFPMSQVPAPPLELPRAEELVSTPTPKPSPPKGPTVTSLTVGGLRFEITGGQSNVKSAFKRALKEAAQPLIEDGISGWTLSVKLDRPQISDNAGMKMCELTAEASARGASRIDLGSITNRNSQFDGTLACEAAAEPLAEAVLTRFVDALPSQ